MSAASDIEDRAARWLLRREEPGWSTEDQTALDAWLAASSLHRVAFYRLEYGWRKADRLAAMPAPAVFERERHSAMPRLGRVAAAAALVVAAVTGGVLLFGGDRVSARIYTTEIGGRSSFPLEDGSQIELNTNSELRTALDATSRTAWLERGEAYFAVAHDAGRPFVIHAGPRLVKVLGTKFSVWRDGDRLVVTVLEGRVEVDAPPASHMVALPGDIVTAEGVVETVRHESLDEAARTLAWREGFVTFDQATLAEVARQFNRYNRRQIVVDPAAAKAIRIGGTFDAGNVDAFVRLLQEAYRLTVKNNGATIEISGKKPSR